MRKLLIGCVCALLAAMSIGCAAPAEVLTLTPEPDLQVFLMDAPEGYIIDERYIPIAFDEAGNIVSHDPALHEPLAEFGPPEFALYYCVDEDGNVQCRAYGEQYEMLERDNGDGTSTAFISVDPLVTGMYEVIVDLPPDEEGETIIIPGKLIKNTDTDFTFEAAEAATTKGEQGNSGGKPAPSPKPANDNAGDTDASGGSAGDENSSGTSGGNNGDDDFASAPIPQAPSPEEPAPMVTPAPTPEPTPEPAPKLAPAPDPAPAGAKCSVCGQMVPDNELTAHMKYHAIHDGGGGYTTE